MSEIITHDLKTWPEYFEALWSGDKTFELREDDRGFDVGHRLLLREYDPDADAFTGRVIFAKVTYLMPVSEFVPVADGYVIMAIRVEEKKDA
jgi:hypothetical protein